MKKIPLLVIFVVTALALCCSGCKKADLDMAWFSVEGSGFYDPVNDTSSIKIGGILQFETPRVSTDPMWARIVDWQFFIREGTQLVMDVNSTNYYSLLGDLVINKSDRQGDFLWVYIETTTAREGDIYNGANPDSMEITFWMVDSNGNTYAMAETVPFEMTR